MGGSILQCTDDKYLNTLLPEGSSHRWITLEMYQCLRCTSTTHMKPQFYPWQQWLSFLFSNCSSKFLLRNKTNPAPQPSKTAAYSMEERSELSHCLLTEDSLRTDVKQSIGLFPFSFVRWSVPYLQNNLIVTCVSSFLREQLIAT